MKWPSVIISQFLKDLDKLPGWVPLYVFLLTTMEFANISPDLSMYGRSLDVPVELFAALCAFIFYQFGDALDDVIFKVPTGSTRSLYSKRYTCQREKARRALRERMGNAADVPCNGIYDLSLKLATAAEKERSAWPVHFYNELAKFLRSLGPTLVVIAAFFDLWYQVVVGLGAAALCLAAYPWLKVLHVRRLYLTIFDLGTKENLRGKLEIIDTDRMLSFFWDKKYVCGVAV